MTLENTKERPIGKAFRKNQKIYAFEIGEGVFLQESDFDSDHEDFKIELLTDSGTNYHWSYWCFAKSIGGWYAREWTKGKAKITVKYHPFNNDIEIILKSKTMMVQYSNDPDDRELFESGDILHLDWESYGVDFPMIIEKWLDRLTGNQIPLSDYFKDPLRRFLDGFSQ